MNLFRNHSIPARRYLIALSLCLLAIRSLSQNIDTGIEVYAQQYNPERTYLHYDKGAYAAGETIWFKAYMMTEIFPAVESKSLYVDWIDDKGNLLQHSVSPLVDAVTNGQFDIPTDYKGNYIQVRAYTKWMLNFDSAFIYNKFLRIIKHAAQPQAKPAPPVPTIAFFPEGGDAIIGINGKIAFKANDQFGQPVRVRGVVTGSDGKVVDSIRTLHDGMGIISITPVAGVSYTARWWDEKNVERSTALPSAKPNGVSLQVLLAGTSRVLNIRYTENIVNSFDSLYVVGTMHSHEAFRFSRATNSPSIKATVPTAQLPSGVLTVTVFDKSWNALAERITYINNDEFRFQADFDVQHWGLNKRARNEIKISIPDSLVANLSVAVTDASIGHDTSSSIISHLFLTSELKGEVYNPRYYLSDTGYAVTRHLDLVMLTHGWRRYKWQEVVAGRIPRLKFERDTSYITMSGKVYGVTPGQLGNNTELILIMRQKDTEGKFLLIPVKPDGTFKDPNTILFDTAHVHYQFQKGKGLEGASVQFMLDRLPAPAATGPMVGINFLWNDTSGAYRQWNLADEANDIANELKVKTLENVTVRSKGKTPIQLLDEKYASGLFTGGDGYQFDLLSDPFSNSAMNIFTYLQGKVAGLQINTTSNPPTLQWRGGSPQLYLDEVPTDASFVSSVSTSDVAYIKVFRPPFMGGMNSANGAIAIYTRRGNDMKQEPGKGLASNKIFGYTQIKEFYSPNYSSYRPENQQRDLRTTLYWNPSVILTPELKERVLTFYNNDVSKAFRIVIEGMTSDGRLTHIEQTME